MKLIGTPEELAAYHRLMMEIASARPESGPNVSRDIPGYEPVDELTAADEDILEAMLGLGAIKQNGVAWQLIAEKAGYRSPKRHRLKAAGLIRETTGATRGMALTPQGVQYAAGLRDPEKTGSDVEP